MAKASAEWSKVQCGNGMEYYWKHSSGETMWKLPRQIEEKVEAGQIEVSVAPNKKIFDEETWKQPWQKVKCPKGTVYWWNVITDETHMKLPKHSEEGYATSKELERMRRVAAQAGVRMVTGENVLKEFGLGDVSPLSSVTPEGTIWNHNEMNNALTSSSSMNNSVDSGAKSSLGRFFKKQPKDDGRARRSTKDDLSLENKIKDEVKRGKGKLKAEDVVRGLEIGAPFDVAHPVHVRFDRKNVRFSGLPSDWDLGMQQQFGVSLHSCPRLDVQGYEDRIPAVLVLLRRALIDLGGLGAEGIFRIAPDGAQCAAVKAKINTCKGYEALEGCQDPNVPANLIKQFFRELKPSLLLNCLSREDLFKFAEMADDANEIEPMVSSLPEPQQSVLLWLLDLLGTVVEYKEVTRMTPKNLAIVLSPNLFDADGPPMEVLALSQKMAVLLENLILWRMRAMSHKIKQAQKQSIAQNAEVDQGQEYSSSNSDVDTSDSESEAQQQFNDVGVSSSTILETNTDNDEDDDDAGNDKSSESSPAAEKPSKERLPPLRSTRDC